MQIDEIQYSDVETCVFPFGCVQSCVRLIIRITVLVELFESEDQSAIQF